MKIYLTRHGQTDWNVAHKFQGKADIELNDVGIQQAKIAKEELKDINIDLIISSPLKRARKTAEIISGEKNIPIICDERISERDFGEFEGQTVEEANLDGFWNYAENVKYEKAENIQSFFKRVYGFLDEMKVKYKDKNVLIVSHGGVSVPVTCYFNGIPNDDCLIKMGIKNCEIKEFDVR